MFAFLTESGFGIFHIYLGCITFGLGYALIATLLGSLGGDAGGHGGLDGSEHLSDFHVDSGHGGAADSHGEGGNHGTGMSPFSPLMIATFLTLFGGLGMVLLGLFGIFKFVPVAFASSVSAILSAPLAVVMTSYFSFFLVKLFINTETTTSISTNKLIGREAEATLDIETDKVGEVQYLMGGSIQTSSARLAEGSPSIKKGDVVEIVAISQNIFWVKPAQKMENINL
ncbi:MAG: NfeD family protein [Candidatus Riflebacteria bacterium]|nr:NfeD family protein [Candidatus Riflebacteria bacterium]